MQGESVVLEQHVEQHDSPSKPEDFVFVQGHRLVKPYHFDYQCTVRRRWIGQSIIEVFEREFPARDRSYYSQALADGRLRVEGVAQAALTLHTPLREGQRLRHFVHRHEPPVPIGGVQVVGETPDMVAVCKPHGMPVHAAGQYRKNTVLGILTAERADLGPLLPVHRLDKPVSGLLLFARSPAAAAAVCRQIESRSVQKVYVARVLGRFPETPEGQPIVVDVPLDWDPVANKASAVPGAEVAGGDGMDEDGGGELAAAGAEGEGEGAGAAAAAAEAGDAAMKAAEEGEAAAAAPGGGGADPTAGLSKSELKAQRKAAVRLVKAQRKAAREVRLAAAAEAAAAEKSRGGRKLPKEAVTEYRLLGVAADGLTSVVECRPRTGRTHQIRVHLQHLGHPIANDAQYGGTYGGPQTCRALAEQMGIHWGRAQQGQQEQGQGQERGGAAPEQLAAGAGGAAAGGDAEAEEAHASGLRADANKRPRLEVPAAAAVAAAAAEVDAAAAAGAAAGGEPGPAAAAATTAPGDGDDDGYAQARAFRSSPEFEAPQALRDPLCANCPYYAPRDYPLDLRPLWLHARAYSCPGEAGWSFATEMPEWAAADWQAPVPPVVAVAAAAAAAAGAGPAGA